MSHIGRETSTAWPPRLYQREVQIWSNNYHVVRTRLERSTPCKPLAAVPGDIRLNRKKKEKLVDVELIFVLLKREQ
jgi:hypothetical protein